jgi:hypothetical protein
MQLQGAILIVIVYCPVSTMPTKQAVASIPRVYSRPADPDVVSFFKLIPEIRNQIYDLLLHTNSDILVRHPDDTGNHGWGEERRGLDAINPGIAILSTSRQVYHEAVGVLYSQNTFCVARSLSFTASHSEDSSILVYASWAERIGSALRLLRDVTVILDGYDIYGRRFFSPRRLKNGRPIDIFPAVKILWQEDMGLLNFRFKIRGRVGLWNIILTWGHSWKLRAADYTLNKFTHLIGNMDALKLRCSSMLIRDIQISQESSEGQIHYQSTPGRQDFVQSFYSADFGTLVTLQQNERPNLLNLPSDVQDMLMSLLPPMTSHMIFSAKQPRDVISRVISRPYKWDDAPWSGPSTTF